MPCHRKTVARLYCHQVVSHDSWCACTPPGPLHCMVVVGDGRWGLACFCVRLCCVGLVCMGDIVGRDTVGGNAGVQLLCASVTRRAHACSCMRMSHIR